MSERKNCLDCGSPLGRGAYKCRCGWSVAPPETYRRGPDCAYAGCAGRTMVSLRTKTGVAYLCHEHYIANHTKEAEAYCAERGLTTTERKIAFCKAMFGKIGQGRPGREWAELILTKAAVGDRVSDMQIRFAREVVKDVEVLTA